MSVPRFGGGKRSASEMQRGQACAVQASQAVASKCASSTDGGSGSGSGSGGGGTGPDEVEEEEDPSSSSQGLIWTVVESIKLEISSGIGVGVQAVETKEVEDTHTETGFSELSAQHRPAVQGEEARVKSYGRISKKQLRDALRIAQEMGGECISRLTIGCDQQLAFKCRLGHIFKSTIEAAASEWCPVCIKYYSQCVEFAQQNNGKLVSTALAKPILFECAKGHQFFCRTYKTKHLKWCQKCVEQEAEEKRARTESARAQETAEKQAEQEELFEEAKRQMEQEARAKAYFEAARYEKYLDQVAKQHARADSVRLRLSETESYWVNRILLTPVEFLYARLQLVEKAQRDSYFRKIALMIHPDKNSHPNSTAAFTKLRQVYERMACCQLPTNPSQ